MIKFIFYYTALPIRLKHSPKYLNIKGNLPQGRNLNI
jgi:hypothetical protein